MISGFILAVAGRDNIAIAQPIAYAICAAAVSIGVSEFLSNRGVTNREIWRWLPAGAKPEEPATPWWRIEWSKSRAFLSLLALGAAGGVVLGLFAMGYLAVLHHIPATAEILSPVPGTDRENSRISNFVCAHGHRSGSVAEEYLFRGLLFRALDREWAVGAPCWQRRILRDLPIHRFPGCRFASVRRDERDYFQENRSARAGRCPSTWFTTRSSWPTRGNPNL